VSNVYRKTPPESDEDWEAFWKAVDQSNKSWVVVGPVYAIVANWKAWLAGLAFFALMQRSEFIALLDMLTGRG
jgi:hypothetical protein